MQDDRRHLVRASHDLVGPLHALLSISLSKDVQHDTACTQPCSGLDCQKGNPVNLHLHKSIKRGAHQPLTARPMSPSDQASP